MSPILYYLGLLLIGLKVSYGFDRYREHNLTPGETYYVMNPSYPEYSSGMGTAVTKIHSDIPFTLTCRYNISSVLNRCIISQLKVYRGNTLVSTDKYCGQDHSFTIQPQSYVTKIVYIAGPFVRGRFICTAKTDTPPNNCTCGDSSPSSVAAAIVNNIDKNIICGGTIISKRHILTSADCLENKDTGSLSVLLGENTYNVSNTSNMHPISKVKVHPNRRGNYRNNIGIVELASPIEYSSKISPACLPFQNERESFSNMHMNALIWSDFDLDNSKFSKMNSVNFEVNNLLYCRLFVDIFVNNEYEMCTRSEEGICNFDSGSPLLWKSPFTNNNVITALAVKTDSKCQQYKLNTRVGPFLDWIVKETPGVEYCRMN